MKPANWPTYMIEKRLRSGEVAYYWNPPIADFKAGFKLHREALGQDLAAACDRVTQLNQHLFAFRTGRVAARDLDLQPGYGTVDWLIERYYRSRAFTKVSGRTQPDYRHALALVASTLTKVGTRFGALKLEQISAAAVDKLYTKHLLKNEAGETRARQAALCIALMRRAWKVVHRLYPRLVPTENPWAGVILEGKKHEIVPATREEAFALSAAIATAGHPHLAAIPLICFEWLQRPENVLAGHLSWGDIRPASHPRHVRIDHHKTGQKVLQPLEDGQGALFPELEAYLGTLTRLGIAVVLTPGERGKHRPYSDSYARRIVREARRGAGLPEHVTLTACRHGGMTELGDAEMTEQQVMALSGHKTPEAARLYVKRTESQRITAARRRRAWVEEERKGDRIQNERENAVSE
jgi:integrase-like protein